MGDGGRGTSKDIHSDPVTMPNQELVLGGTVTSAVNRGKRGLQYAIEKGEVMWHQAEVVNTIATEGGRRRLKLSDGSEIEVDQVLLATGFSKNRPGGRLVEDLVQNAGLPVSNFCGYPVVDERLKWHPRIHVAGGLAELELGPAARNIAGARQAAERICGGIDDGVYRIDARGCRC